jgi:hypothetical protein
LKGVSTVWLQTAIDCHSRRAWARLYTSKLPITAVQLLDEDVPPAVEAADARIEVALSAERWPRGHRASAEGGAVLARRRGRAFCGRPDRRPYELFLQLEGVDHRLTKMKRPRSNGRRCLLTSAASRLEPQASRARFAERLHRTLLQHFHVDGRRTWFETGEEMETALDAHRVTDNEKRPRHVDTVGEQPSCCRRSPSACSRWCAAARR